MSLVRALGAALACAAALPATALAAGGQIEASLPKATIRVDAQGRFTFPVACDDAGPSCAGDLRLSTTSQAPRQGAQLGVPVTAKAATTLGVATFTVAAGRHRRVPVQLNAAGRRALARRRGKIYLVNVRVRQRDGAGDFSAVVAGTIDLRAAATTAAAPARAAARSCTRGGATTVAAEDGESVVAVKATPKGDYLTDRLYACAGSTGRRVYLFSSTRRDSERPEYDTYTFIDDRHVGVTASISFGIGSTYTAAVYDLRSGKRTHTTGPCDQYQLSDTASGPDEVVFLPRGGIAYSCGTLRIADAQGDRELEPAGSAVSHLAYGNGRLYWTLTAGGTETLKSLDA
jgi:hypothetical protein